MGKWLGGPHRPGPMMAYVQRSWRTCVCVFFCLSRELSELSCVIAFSPGFFGNPKLKPRGFGFPPWVLGDSKVVLNNTLYQGIYTTPTWICFCLAIFLRIVPWYIIYIQTTIWKNIFGTFSKHGTVANPSFCTITGWGGSFQGIANLIRITDPCTELGLTGGKLENSSSLDEGTGTNDLLTWYESLKTLDEGLFKYPYWRIK